MDRIAEQLKQPGLGVIIAAMMPFFMLIWFVRKPFDIDAPLFVWMAQQIADAPFDFYGFSANWKHTLDPVYEVMQNPPLLSYSLVPLGVFSDWSEVTFHLWMIALAMAASAGIYKLAQQLCEQPLVATTLAVMSPGFLMSASEIMADIPLLAAWVWATLLWVRGMEEQRRTLLVASAILVAIAGLTKYFGVALLPLLIAYTVYVDRPDWKQRIRPLLIPTLTFLFYEIYTFLRYGRGLILDAGAFVAEFERDTPLGIFGKLLTILVFVGGGIPGVFLFAALQRRRIAVLFALAIPLVIGLHALLPGQGFFPTRFEWDRYIYEADFFWRAEHGPWDAPWFVVLLWSIFLVGGCLNLSLAMHPWYVKRDPQTFLLALWIAGTCAFCLLFYHLVNIRVLLPMFPAIAIAMARTIKVAPFEDSQSRIERFAAPFYISGFLAVGVLMAGYEQAQLQRSAAQDLARETGSNGQDLWFTGHFAFQYYMQEQGAKSLDIKDMGEISVGDRFVLPSNTPWPLFPKEEAVELLDVLAYQTLPWCSVTSYHRFVGFYADTIGPLPYALVTGHPDEFALFQITKVPFINLPETKE